MSDLHSISTNPAYLLQQIQIRPIVPVEKKRWDLLMKQHHYLGLKRLIGETIRYIATIDTNWVGLLGWGSAALHCKAREQWIGWSTQLKYQRLHLIANNVRFLILPWIRVPNLASKILALNLKRLSSDWESYHGHPVVLAETFVDPQKFSGTCYKAAGWSCLGQTQGYRKSAKHYIHHGHSKLIFIKSLTQTAKNDLTMPLLPNNMEGKKMTLKFTCQQLDDLKDHLRKLPDIRNPKGVRHPYKAVIGIAICAVLSGAKSYVEIGEWAQACTQNQLKRFGTHYDEKTNRFVPPSESCIRRTLQRADVLAIDNALSDWIYSMTHEASKALAIDGKVVKGAKDNEGHQVHLLSGFLHQQGVVVGQITIDDKTNEIPELKRLLEPMNIEGKVVTADALHTQTQTASYIVSKKKPTMS